MVRRRGTTLRSGGEGRDDIALLEGVVGIVDLLSAALALLVPLLTLLIPLLALLTLRGIPLLTLALRGRPLLLLLLLRLSGSSTLLRGPLTGLLEGQGRDTSPVKTRRRSLGEEEEGVLRVEMQILHPEAIDRFIGWCVD